MTSPLFFIHATKTAGGTLKEGLAALKNHKVGFVYNKHDRENLDIKNCDIVYGHFQYGLHEQFDVPPRYAIFLRNPFARTVSHFYHLRNVDGGPVGQKFDHLEDMDQYYAGDWRHWELTNLLCRMVSGQARHVKDWDACYEQAVANLSHFEFVGFQEHFDLSIRRLSSFLKEDLKIERNVNVGAYKATQVSKEALKHVCADNAHDAKLYAYVTQRFMVDDWGKFAD